MARDPGLERILREELRDAGPLTEVPMFGGLAFLWAGHLLCCADASGLLVRLGRGNDGWALALHGATPLRSGTRPMKGWVRLPPALRADEELRRRCIAAALAFVHGLPPK